MPTFASELLVPDFQLGDQGWVACLQMQVWHLPDLQGAICCLEFRQALCPLPVTGGTCAPPNQLEGPLNLTGGRGQLSVVAVGGRAFLCWPTGWGEQDNSHSHLGGGNPTVPYISLPTLFPFSLLLATSISSALSLPHSYLISHSPTYLYLPPLFIYI